MLGTYLYYLFILLIKNPEIFMFEYVKVATSRCFVEQSS